MFTKFLMDKMDKKLQQQHQQQQQQQQQQKTNPLFCNQNLQAKLAAIEAKLKQGSNTNITTTTSTQTNANNKSSQEFTNNSRNKETTAATVARQQDRCNMAAIGRYCVPHNTQQQMAQPHATVLPLLTQVQRVNNDLSDKLTRMARRNTIKFREFAALQVQDKNAEALLELHNCIPEISQIFDMHCRIGSGTFSTVLLGTLKRERQLPEVQRRRFAIKHHNPTNHPERILRELECMFRMGGDHNIIGINCCIRCNENVAFVMPFMSHDRYHDVFRNLSLFEVQDYLRNLLIALQHVHKFNVIHRDVKPSNILYNRRTGKFLLCDFGLAQRLAEDGRLIQPSDLSAATALLRDIDAAQQQLMQRHDGNSLQAENEAAAHRKRAVGGGTTVFGETSSSSTTTISNSSHQQLLTEPTKKELAIQKADTQRLITRLRCTNASVDQNNYVISTNTSRKEMHASRAGTPGYRPPEVLLRYPHQTTAVDVWAAGVIMLSMLSTMHPFFKAPSDCAALLEIMNLFGDLELRKTAFMLDRLVLITQKVTALDLRRVCMRLRYAEHFLSPEMQRRHRRADGNMEMCRQCDQATFNCICKHSSHQLETYDGLDMFPPHAYDLLGRLLEVNPQKRITAEEALKHPFFGDHHRIASGIPLSQQMRSREALHTNGGSRTLTSYASPQNTVAASTTLGCFQL